MPIASDEAGLLFSFADMQHEIDNMREMARRFLAPLSYERTLPAWLRELRNFSTNPHGSKLSWSIALGEPIQTVNSIGEYEPDDEGGHTVFGTLTAVWDIQTPKSGAKSKKKEAAHTHFLLVGRASTKLTILEFQPDGGHRELARWKFEVG